VRVSDGAELGAEAWDRLVLAQPEGGLLQSWAWGALQERFGWAVHRLVFDAGASGACSLQRTRTMLPGGRVDYVPRGPAVPRQARAEAIAQLVLRARAAKTVVLRVEPNAPEGAEWPAALAAQGFSPGDGVQPAATQLLDLRPAEGALRADLKPKTRYNLGLSQRKGVRVTQSRDVPAFAHLVAVTARRQRIRLPDAHYFASVLELFGSENARLYFAFHADTLLAGILGVRFGTVAHYLFGGSTERGRELMPNYLLHWTAMLDFKAMGCTTYDWWGVASRPAPEDPWFGLHRFKTGFGGTTVRYPGLFDLALRPRAWRWENRLRKLKRRVRATILR